MLRFLLVSVVALSQYSAISWDEQVIARHYELHGENNLNPNQISVTSSGLYYQALAVQNSQALLQHYLHNQDFEDEQKVNWLTQHKLINHWQANWLLGLYWREQGQLPRAKLWMKSALETYQFNTERRSGVQYSRLLLQLADVLQQLKEFRAANRLLNDRVFIDEHTSIALYSEAIYLRAKGLMLEGHLQQAKDLLDNLFTRLGVHLIARARALRQRLDDLLNEQYQVDNCVVNVQMLVSDYFQWQYAHQLLTEWKGQSHLNRLSICFKPIQSFDPKPLVCRDEDNLRLSCDLRAMAENLSLDDSVLPVIVHGQSGVANYNNGIVFTNFTKSNGVFIHELFHHFGFIDEYPLTGSIGRKICSVPTVTIKGENLIVVPLSEVEQYRSSSLYKRFGTTARTCKEYNSVAYKLSPTMNIMGYMDQQVPKEYLAKAQDKMLHRFNTMSNYQYAFALAYEQANDMANYHKWLQKSAQQGYLVSKALLAN